MLSELSAPTSAPKQPIQSQSNDEPLTYLDLPLMENCSYSLRGKPFKDLTIRSVYGHPGEGQRRVLRTFEGNEFEMSQETFFLLWSFFRKKRQQRDEE